ncbi:hypothetical protein C8R48DRAFT_717420 [Suillus tomentosus]|nr:hypothetical protein C8R48DRAFT_717420 [Suillus tomentosus]
MKLSLVYTALASIVVLATAYPMQGAIAEQLLDVEKREVLNADDFSYKYSRDGVEGKREELIADVFNYLISYEREELD